MKTSIKKNIIFNLFYQIVNLGFPLITVPYISRILGVSGIGVNAFTLSITQYFIIFGSLGLSLYGTRQIAYTRDSQSRMSETFWSILLIRFICLAISFALYFLLVMRIEENRVIFLVQSVMIIATMFDISWLYFGLESICLVLVRNLFFKALGVVGVFLLIKGPEDLLLYVSLNAGIVLFGNLILFIGLPKIIHKATLSFKEILSHTISSLKLFAPQIASQVYLILDKTMIGLFSDIDEVAFYHQPEKLIKTILALVTSISIVMLPRMSNLFMKGDYEKMKGYLNRTLIRSAFITIPMSFGIASIGREFLPLFLGPGYGRAEPVLLILSSIIFIISVSNVTGTQYLLPSNRTKEFTSSIVLGAIINFTINLILIPKYGALGAAFGTVVAEAFVTGYQLYCVRSEIFFKGYLSELMQYVLSSLGMVFVIQLIRNSLGIGLLSIVYKITLGIFIYIILLSFVRNKTWLSIIRNCKNHFLRRNNKL
ncbi:MAG: flippase [Sphaerochaeta sp.]|nr:flippase [Sphaerochaeta sp.]